MFVPDNESLAMQNVVDLASERFSREQLEHKIDAGAESFIAGLQHAGQSLANLAWVLARPVRQHDQELKEGIYNLVMERLRKIVVGTVDDSDHTSEMAQQAERRALQIAFAAFEAHLLVLTAAEHAKTAAVDTANPKPR